MMHHTTSLTTKLAYILPVIAANPFYRHKYGIEDLPVPEAEKYILTHFYELPVLTRAEIPHISRDAADGRSSIMQMTGGTTGAANIIEWCTEDAGKAAIPLVEAIANAQIPRGSFALSLVTTSLAAYGIHIELACRQQGLAFIGFNHTDLDLIETIVRNHAIKVIFGTPAGILGIVSSTQLRDYLQSVELVITAGAKITAEEMHTIESALHCHCISNLGTTELGAFGMQTSLCDGFHLDSRVIEAEVHHIDKKGIGDCIMTALLGRRTPIIRYECGDRGRILQSCSCGQSGPILQYHGRKSETFFIGGTKISIETLEAIARYIGANPTLQAFVFPRETPARIQLNIVSAPQSWTLDTIAHCLLDVNTALRNKLLTGKIRLDIDFIPKEKLVGLNARGKWRRIIQHPQPDK